MMRDDILNTAILTADKPSGLLLRCPHCGLVDRNFSAQGMREAHFQITRVGAVRRNECGKCRKQFHTIEICVPTGTTPMEFYSKINALLMEEHK